MSLIMTLGREAGGQALPGAFLIAVVSDKSKISKKGFILSHSWRREGHGELVIFQQREVDAYY